MNDKTINMGLVKLNLLNSLMYGVRWFIIIGASTLAFGLALRTWPDAKPRRVIAENVVRSENYFGRAPDMARTAEDAAASYED